VGHRWRGGGDGSGRTAQSLGGAPRRPRPSAVGGGNVTSLDDFLKKSRERFGGRFPQSDGKPYWLYGLAIAAVLWLAFTSIHRIGPQQAGVVTRFGSYAGTMRPGIGFSLPWPVDRVEKIDVQEIRTADIPTGGQGAENLILTGDQNMIDLAYSVRWNIADPERFLFQIANPEETIREVAESAMRAGGRGRLARRGDRLGPKRDRAARRAGDAAASQRLSGRRSSAGHRDQAIGSSGRGHRRLQGRDGRAAGSAILCQPGARLRASAHRQGAGRSGRVRQGVHAVQAVARSDPPPHVL
jgi:hypothetical protein